MIKFKLINFINKKSDVHFTPRINYSQFEEDNLLVDLYV